MAEIEVAGLVERHEVDMHMRHIDTYNGLANFDARTNLFQTLGNAFGEEMKLAEKLIVEVENIVDLLLGDAEDMAGNHGVDVEERETMFGLGDFIAGDFACHDTGKDCSHTIVQF
jgi:hypothetical protein